MEFVFLGNIVNTHGLKGEVRILSSLSHKEQIFKTGFTFYVEEKPYQVSTYRKHKNYDMVTFEGLQTIDDVLPLKGKEVYICRNDLDSDFFLETDYIRMDVFSDKGNRGTVKSILKGVAYNYLEVEFQSKVYYVPNIPPFISQTSREKNQVWITEIEGLIDEN